MSKADEFLEHFTSLDKALNSHAIETQTKQIGAVKYTIYSFEDGSKFTQGDNGFIGSETPAQSENKMVVDTPYSLEFPVETVGTKKVRYRRISDRAEFIFLANDSIGQRQTLKDSSGNVIHVSYADLKDFEEIK